MHTKITYNKAVALSGALALVYSGMITMFGKEKQQLFWKISNDYFELTLGLSLISLYLRDYAQESFKFSTLLL